MLTKRTFTTLLLLFGSTHLLAGPLLDAANKLYTTGKLHDAVTAYRHASREGESPALCYFNSANAYYQLDSLPQSVVFYKACIAAAPDYSKAYLNLGIAYYALNDMPNCIGVMRRYCGMETANQKGRLVLASAYRAVGDLANAALTLENLASDYPQMDEPYIALGEIYRELNDDDEALQWLNSYPASGRHLEYIYNMQADLFEQRGDYAHTLFYLEQLFSLNNSKKWTLYKIATIQEKMGNDLVAYETAVDGMSRFPDFAEMAVLAGNLAFNRHRLEDAERCYTAAYKLGSAAAIVGLGNVNAIRKQEAQTILQ